MQNQHIHFIITGGTFDGALKETGAVPTSTVVGAYLGRSIQPAFSYSLDIPFLKDSRDITEDDRSRIIDLLNQTQHELVVVTHGTFTLVQTAQRIASQLCGTSKTIIVIGSMIPFEESWSDAAFNLGFACSAALLGAKGVWVAMHGRLWHPDEVMKNLASNKFVERNRDAEGRS